MTGYIARHWRGQLPLAQSLWVNGLLSLLPFAVWFALARNAFHATSISRFILVAILPFLVLLLVDSWGVVGLWRCASKQNKFGKRTPTWASRGAQLVVIVNVAAVLAAVVMLADQSRALVRTPQPAPPTYEVTLRGNTAVFQGRMSAAAADELELLLSDKSVKRLAIAHTAQGEVTPALPLMKIIRARKLFVVALEMCDAACTALLTAGDVRAIVPQTVLNFGRAKPEPVLHSLIAAGIVTTIFDAATKRYVRASLWCAKNPVACARTGHQNAQARQRGDRKNGA